MTIVEQQPTQEADIQEKRNRHAFKILFIAGLLIAVASLFVLIRALLVNESWIEPVVGISVGVVMIGAAYLAKKGKMVVAMMLTAVMMYGLDLYLISEYSAVGLPLTVSFIAILAIIASQILPAEQMVGGLVSIVVVGILIILADLYWPFERSVLGTSDTTIIYLGALATMSFALVMAIIQFPNYTLRGKLISASVIVITLVVMLTTVISNSIVRQSLTFRLGDQLTLLGHSDAATATELLTEQVNILKTLGLDSSLRGLVRNQNVDYGDEDAAVAAINDIESRWKEDSDLAVPILRNASSRTLATFQRAFPDHLGVLVTDEYGGLAGATYTPDQYAYADTAWWQAAYNDGKGAIYIGQPEYAPVLDDTVIPIALPILTADTNGVVGILQTSFALDSLLALNHDLGETGRIAYLFDDQMISLDKELDRHVLQPPVIGAENLEQLRANPDELLIAEVNEAQRVLILAAMGTDGELPAIDALNWAIILQQEYAEAFAAVDTLQRASVVLGIIAVVLGTAVAAYAAGWVTKPINHLTETAVAIAEGDFEQHAAVETKDEIGTLAIAFNSMTDQLRLFISSLEARVADRTQALTISSDVSRTLSTIVSVEELVEEIVRQMHDAFGYYHAQLFLLDENGQLVLHSGTGEVGKIMLAASHQIPVGQGVVGRAAFGNETVLINDVMLDDNWLYNADLPDTKCEISVPIAIGNHVLGVLDIQHNVVNSFDSEMVELLQSIAVQTALAVQNARTFERAEQQQRVLTETLTASEQQSHNLSLLNEFSAALTVATTLEDVYRIAENHILEMLQADSTAIVLLTTSGKEVEALFANGVRVDAQEGLILPVEGTVVDVTVKENRLVQLPEERPLTDFTDIELWYKRNDTKSVISVPLSAGVSAFGAMNIGSKREKAFESIDVGFVLQIANLLAITIEGQRLAEEARLLAGIVENHPDFIGVGTPDGHAVYINPSGLQMVGLPPDHNVAGMDSSSFYVPEDAVKLLEVGLPIAIEQGSWSAEATVKAADGALIPVEETLGINYDADGNMAGFSITMRDITDRNAAAKALRDSEQSARDFQAKLTLLHEISTDLSSLDTVEKIYEQAIAVGRETLGFDRVRLWLIDEKLDLMLGTFGMGEDGVVYDARHFQIPFTDSWAASIIKIRQGREVSSELDLHHEGDVVGHGWQIAAVLLDAGQPIGWLAVDNLFAQEQMLVYEPELVSLFANTLANVIVSKRTADTFAKQASELQIVTEVSRSAAGLMNRDGMLQYVADAIWEKFELYHVQIFMLHAQTRTLRLTAVSDSQNHPSVDDAPSIQMDEQICIISHAAHQRKALIANDVLRESSYVESPDLSNTKAIMAVPLILGHELLGVINLHSVELNHFTDIDVNVQMTLASQIAAALRNVTQYQEAQEALAELTQLQQMVSRENWEAFMTSQTRTVQGYLFDQHTVQSIEKGADERVVDGKTAVISPLTVQGITIGGLSARNPSGEPLTEDQQELLDAAARQVAEALERARLLEVTESGRQELDKRAEQLAVINEVAQVVSQQLEESELFTAVHEQVTRAIVTDTFFIAMYDADREHFNFPYFYDDEKMHKVPPMPVDPKMETTQVWQSSESICVNYTPEEFWDREAEEQNLLLTGDDGDDAQRPSNMAFIPLMAGAKAIGVMSVQNYQFHDFTEDDISLLFGIANHVGLALENLRLFTDTQRRAERERLINEISQKIQGAQTVQGAMQTAVSELGRALKIKKAVVELN